MKKRAISVFSGVLFCLSLAALLTESHVAGRSDASLGLVLIRNAEYSGFSSAFYFAKDELPQTDSGTMIIPGNCNGVRVFVKHKADANPSDIEIRSERPGNPGIFSGIHRAAKGECTVSDTFIGYNFSAAHQYLIVIAVVTFIAFFASLLVKTKTRAPADEV